MWSRARRWRRKLRRHGRFRRCGNAIRSWRSPLVTTRGSSHQPALATVASETTLLVLGSRGLGSVAGFMLGSVGPATVSATEQPVVLVRAAKGR
ncbi:universal stress protein [Streptomyces sp. NPDC023998]|uniref:universal stress protein n=1 Tax=Streptomyces sp. NPDC023998 TaxID=3154597 RepID=UPI0034101FF9